MNMEHIYANYARQQLGKDRAHEPSISNTSLFHGQGGALMQRRIGASGRRLACIWCGPPSPLRGIIGLRAAASRTPCGRRCAAGLRPVLDPAVRSHGMAAAREREQLCLRPRRS